MNSKHCAVSVALLTMLIGCGDEGDDVPRGSTGESGSTGSKIDACRIVTQDDATRLFGKPASPYEGTPVIDPNMMGECLWTWDSETSNHLLQFRIWNGERYYSSMPDSEPVDFAEQGFIRAHPMAGVDIGWIQDGKMVSLSYSTIGPDVPKAMTKADQVKRLALKVKSEL